MHKTNNQFSRSPWSIFAAIILGIFFGIYFGKEGTLFNISLYSLFDGFSALFINALTLIVVPLVSSSIISGMARVAKDEAFGRLGGKIFSFYIGTTLLAILVGLFFVNLIQPGHLIATSQFVAQGSEQISGSLQEKLASHSIWKLIIAMVPSNIFRSFSQGEMVPIVFFSLIFGYAVSKIESDKAEIVKDFFHALFQAMISLTQIIMKFLPYGVFCLVAKIFMTTGMASLASASLFSLTVILGLCTFMFLVLPLVLKLVGKVAPFRHLKAMSPALITAFSTSSSSATLPVTLDCVEKRAGVSNRICSLVVPLGTSINMSGSALYECVATIFIAQCYGIDLSIWTQCLIVFMSLIASMGVAGVPSGSLVAILLIANSVGLPAEGIGLFIAVDRLLDMSRTMVNVFSDSCCAVLVAKTEGEENILANV